MIRKVSSFWFRRWPLWLIFGLGLTPILWFKKGLFIAGGDDFELLNPGVFADFFRYVWNIKLTNVGGVILAIPRLFPMVYFWKIFEFLGLSPVVIEKFWIVLLFLLPGLSMYYFVSQISKSSWSRLIAASFYMFNLFVTVIGPGQTNIKLVLTALPLMLVFFIKGLNSGRKGLFKYSSLVGLTSLICAGSNVNPPAVAVIPITLTAYLVYHLLVSRGKDLVHGALFALSALISYVLLNFWWVANFLFNIIPEAVSVKKAAAFTALSTGGFTDFFRLLGSWGWRSSHYNLPYYPYAHFYDEPLLLFLSFLIPFLVFLAVYLKPSDKNVIFFSLLALLGLFLSKGSAPPLGFIYQWLWEKIPGFWAFREPFSKFTPVVLFSYSFLLGATVEAVSERVEARLRTRKSLVRIWLTNLFPSTVLGVILVVAYPLLTGEVIWKYWNGSMRSFYAQVPGYWSEAQDWFNRSDKTGRVLLTPKGGYGAAYNWEYGFSSAVPPAAILLINPILWPSIPVFPADRIVEDVYKLQNFKKGPEFVRLLSLLGVRYVLQENDLDWRYASATLPPSESNRFFNSLGFPILSTFGTFDVESLSKIPNAETKKGLHESLYKELTGQPALILYEVSPESSLPHFYVPQKIIQANDVGDLASVLSVENYPLRSAVYLDAPSGTSDGKVTKMMEKPDSLIVKPKKIELSDVNSPALNDANFVWPKTSVLPDSPLYFLVSWQEKRLINREKNPLSRTDLLLWLTLKRLVEMDKMVDLGKIDLAAETFNRYRRQLEEVVSRLERLSREGSNPLYLIIKTDLSFFKQKEILEEIRSKISDKSFSGDIFESYSFFNRVSALVPDRDLLSYQLDKPTEGWYTPLIMSEPGLDRDMMSNYFERVNLTSAGKNVATLSALPRVNSWYEYPQVYLSDDYYSLSLPLPKMKNLVADGSFEEASRYETGEFDGLSDEAVDGQHSLKMVAENFAVKEVNWPIGPLERGVSYRLSFNYRNQIGSPLKLLVLSEEDYRSRSARFGEVDKASSLFETGLKNETSWQHFEKIFDWDLKEGLGRVVFVLSSGKSRDISLIDDLIVTRIYEPNLVFKSAWGEEFAREKSLPRITFMRVNPTKYRVLVEGAEEPFSLVFSESFHSGWKAYVRPTNPPALAKKFDSDGGHDYFDGQVKEGSYKNVFFDGETLETWARKPLAESHHSLVNGYANSWFITPDNSGGRPDYEVIIEFAPQRLFYISALISGFSLLAVLSFLLVRLRIL